MWTKELPPQPDLVRLLATDARAWLSDSGYHLESDVVRDLVSVLIYGRSYSELGEGSRNSPGTAPSRAARDFAIPAGVAEDLKTTLVARIESQETFDSEYWREFSFRYVGEELRRVDRFSLEGHRERIALGSPDAIRALGLLQRLRGAAELDGEQHSPTTQNELDELMVSLAFSMSADARVTVREGAGSWYVPGGPPRGESAFPKRSKRGPLFDEVGADQTADGTLQLDVVNARSPIDSGHVRVDPKLRDLLLDRHLATEPGCLLITGEDFLVKTAIVNWATQERLRKFGGLASDVRVNSCLDPIAGTYGRGTLEALGKYLQATERLKLIPRTTGAEARIPLVVMGGKGPHFFLDAAHMSGFIEIIDRGIFAITSAFFDLPLTAEDLLGALTKFGFPQAPARATAVHVALDTASKSGPSIVPASDLVQVNLAAKPTTQRKRGRGQPPA